MPQFLRGFKGLAVVTVVAVVHTVALTAQDTEVRDRGRTLTRLLYTEAVDSLYDQMAEAFASSIGGRAAVAQLAQQVANQLGDETAVVAEETYTLGGVYHYYRIARFAGLPNQTMTINWAWQARGKVIGGQVRPTPQSAPTEYADYTTKTPLRLPFDGEWTVMWGGRTPSQNYHVVSTDQRFAYDLLIIRDGFSHVNNGADNEDYHCYGTPILAPEAGQVVVAVDTLPDNTPGQMNAAVPPGNHVVIDHGNGEFSLLAHLMHGSVVVDIGDDVARAEPIGDCGNSGNSSEPHLHYHLQTGSAFGVGVGLPAFFNDYEADDVHVERGEPVRGQRIRPAQR